MDGLRESVLEYLRNLGSNVRKVYDLLVNPDYGLQKIMQAIENIQPGAEIDPIPDDFIEGLFDENTEIENESNGE